MNQSTFNNQPIPRFDPQTGRPIEQPREQFHILTVIFAWLSLLAGYAFCRAFPFSSHPLGGFLYISALYLATYIVLAIKKAKFRLIPIIISATALLISPALIITANSFFHFLVSAYAIVAWFYFIYGAFENCLEMGFSNLLIIDFFKATLIMPFASFGKIFSALSQKKNKKGGGIIGKIILGLLLALIPTAIIFGLLSYDSGFVALTKKILIISWGDFFRHLGSLLLGLPIAAYLFGAFYSAEKKKAAEIISAEKCSETASKLRCLPLLTAFAATMPILLIYCLFFASQWKYYLSAFSGILPDAMTCAEYARSGFFQLCAVSFINLIIIAFLGLFVRRKSELPKPLIRILSILFSLATLVLMATAFSKLYLYIQRFGLTPLRIYAAWFMIILAVLFIFVIMKQFLPRLKIIAIGALACILLFGMLTLSGIDTKIAEYNTDRYINGSLETIDINAMRDLGDAAVPSMVRLAQYLDQKDGTDITALTYEEVYIIPFTKQEQTTYELLCKALYDAAKADNSGFFSYNIPSEKAKKALSVAGIKELVIPDEY